jgi:hypothetical protein
LDTGFLGLLVATVSPVDTAPEWDPGLEVEDVGIIEEWGKGRVGNEMGEKVLCVSTVGL